MSNQKVLVRRILLAALLSASVVIAAAAQEPKPEPKKPLTVTHSTASSARAEELETCQNCHDDVVKKFGETRHGRADKFHASGFTEGCASCHGDVKEHSETGDPAKIKSLKTATPEEASNTCLSCHANQHGQAAWLGSVHESSGLSCLSCHSVHNAKAPDKLLVAKTAKDTCLSCHTTLKKSQFQRSTHLLMDEHRNALISCETCHNPHGSQAPKLIKAASTNDLCYQCHGEKRGPFLWQHPPVQENCLTCHTPHGSNNTGLLAMRTPQLCQSCHMQGRHQTVAGYSNTMWNINRTCLSCHSQIHGSNHPSGVKLHR